MASPGNFSNLGDDFDEKILLDDIFDINYCKNSPIKDETVKYPLDNDNNTESENLSYIDSSWRRKPLTQQVDTSQCFIFQQMDIDFYHCDDDSSMNCFEIKYRGKGPTFRLYGLTKEGHSVLTHVYGFRPYIFIQVPENFSQEYIPTFITALNEQIVKNCPKVYLNSLNDNRYGANFGDNLFVLDVELTKKSSIYGYQYNKLYNFLKITFSIPQIIPTARKILESGVGLHIECFGHIPCTITYESNIDFETRFMVDTLLMGCNWIELKPNKYQLIKNKQSICQIELQTTFDSIISHSPEADEWCHIAPLRIMSFDIECAGRKGIFPEPEIDPVIQIASYVVELGHDIPLSKVVFTLNSCAPIVGTQVISFNDESSMLNAWRDYVIQIDPDVITGYNIVNFDVPYLINRSKTLNVSKFQFLGRIKNDKSQIRITTFQNKAYGKRENKCTNISGRLQLDILQILLREYKLRSYSLNSVSFHFLNEQKEDVHYSIITDLQNGDEQTRRRLAIYCLKDSLLPLRLMNKLMLLVNLIEMARVTGVPVSWLLSRGQQIKVISQLMRKAKVENHLIPSVRSIQNDEYEGATVIEPLRGFYNVPVATLDFNSLYPSIMIAHNLCYTTLLSKSDTISMNDESKYIETPSGHYFVKASEKVGLLPSILQHLLSTRKKVKDALKVEKDPFKKKVLDGRQLALKITANSVYGFTGAQVGKLPCLEISSSTTSFGREMIEFTKNHVEKKYTVANGYKYDSKVIYGDTDSVMVKFGNETVSECIDLGKEAARYVSSKFIKPINLEFEKVYFPYLLINKKRYAGLIYTNSAKYSHIDCKGIETVRRDNCPLVANLANTCLDKILIDRDPQGAIDYAKSVISDLLCNRVDISQLVITKELSRASEDYAGKQAHVELSERMKKRDPGSAPKMGDRVPYVIVAGGKNEKTYEKAEDPIYVLENNIPIDTKYYLENQLSKPLLRIFDPILNENASTVLLSGTHTLSKSVVTSTTGLLTKFIQRKVTCIGCKASLPDDRLSSLTSTNSDKIISDYDFCKSALCDHCLPFAPMVYRKELAKLSSYQHKFSSLWTECQRCQGSLMEEVLCTNRDCPIFYMRKKVQKDLIQQQKLVSRFGHICKIFTCISTKYTATLIKDVSLCARPP